MRSSRFLTNYAASFGAAAYLSDTTMTASMSVFELGESTDGAGIASYGSDGVISDCVISIGRGGYVSRDP